MQPKARHFFENPWNAVSRVATLAANRNPTKRSDDDTETSTPATSKWAESHEVRQRAAELDDGMVALPDLKQAVPAPFLERLRPPGAGTP